MTQVITGAAGHVGANLVRALLARGERVRALVHSDRRALEGLPLEVVAGDVGNVESLRRAFRGTSVVYHTAAHISLLGSEGALLERTNVIGTRNVVQACLECRVRRLIHFSSIHALVQEPLDVPVDEARPLVGHRAGTPYGCSKAAAEAEVQAGLAHGLDAVILNPTAIIGPYDFRPSHFGEVLLDLARGRLPALVDGGFDWVDVRDVVQGALRAAERAPAGARYLLSGHWVSLGEIAALVEELTGRRRPRFVCPLALARVSAPLALAMARLRRRPLFTPVSIESLAGNRHILHERASRELGYRPRPFRETIVDTLHWFAENGQLPASVIAAGAAREAACSKLPSSTA